MTTQSIGRNSTISNTTTHNSPFAATPVWDRKRKSGGFGGRKFATAPYAGEPVAHPLSRPALAHDANRESAPVFQSRASKTRTNAKSSTLTIAAVIGTVGVLGAAGWLMTRDGGDMPARTTAPSVQVVTASPTPDAAPIRAKAIAATALPVPAPFRRAATITHAMPVARTAKAVGNVDAVLPSAPQPYTTLTPSAAPQTVVDTRPAVIAVAPDPSPAPAPTATTPELAVPPM